MRTINSKWHAAHKLPRKATLDERIEWHIKHAVECACRPMPASILAELDRRGLGAPTARSLR